MHAWKGDSDSPYFTGNHRLGASDPPGVVLMDPIELVTKDALVIAVWMGA